MDGNSLFLTLHNRLEGISIHHHSIQQLFIQRSPLHTIIKPKHQTLIRQRGADNKRFPILPKRLDCDPINVVFVQIAMHRPLIILHEAISKPTAIQIVRITLHWIRKQRICRAVREKPKRTAVIARLFRLLHGIENEVFPIVLLSSQGLLLHGAVDRRRKQRERVRTVHFAPAIGGRWRIVRHQRAQKLPNAEQIARAVWENVQAVLLEILADLAERGVLRDHLQMVFRGELLQGVKQSAASGNENRIVRLLLNHRIQFFLTKSSVAFEKVVLREHQLGLLVFVLDCNIGKLDSLLQLLNHILATGLDALGEIGRIENRISVLRLIVLRKTGCKVIDDGIFGKGKDLIW